MTFHIDKPRLYRVFWQIPAIIAIAIVVGIASNAIRKNPLPFIGDWSTEGRLTTKSGEKLTIPLADAVRLFEQNAAIFIDARDALQYDEDHIKGAKSLPWHDAEKKFVEVTQGIPEDALIVTYCDGETCELSHDLASFLRDMGFSNVRVLVDGWSLWLENNLPVEGGK